MQEGDSEGAQGAVHLLGNVQTQDVHDEDRRPAEEELEDDHKQHSYHVLFGFDALLEVGASQPLEVVLLLLFLVRAPVVSVVLTDRFYVPPGLLIPAALAQVVVAVLGVVAEGRRRFAVSGVDCGDGIVVGRRRLGRVGLRVPAVLARSVVGRRNLAKSTDKT